MNRFHHDKYLLVEEEAAALDLIRKADSNQPPPKKKRKVEETIEVKLDKAEVIEACVTLVTVNGRPFSHLEDSGLRKLLDPILAGLGGSLTISRRNIGPFVIKKAEDLRQELVDEIKDRFISVKVDSAKRLSRSILGINIQYVKNGKIILRTLASKQLRDRQTGIHLKDTVCDILTEFGINLSNVYSVTTDNGANIVLAVKLMASARDKLRSQENGNRENSDEGVSF